MNDRCLTLIDNLRSEEFYTFLKMGLGIYAFLTKMTIDPKRPLFSKVSNKNSEKRIKNKRRPYYFALMGTDNVNKTFHDEKGHIHQVKIFFSDIDDDLLECVLRAAKLNLDWSELYPSESLFPSDDLYPSEEIFNPCFGRKILDDFYHQTSLFISF